MISNINQNKYSSEEMSNLSEEDKINLNNQQIDFHETNDSLDVEAMEDEEVLFYDSEN